jgi:hypothetical protein
MIRCTAGNAAVSQNFIMKSGMRFITLFFIIPVLPLKRREQDNSVPEMQDEISAAFIGNRRVDFKRNQI